MPLLILRFAIFAAICCALVFWWATRVGHSGGGIVAGGIFTSWAAVVAWVAATMSERVAVAAFGRLCLHVAVAFVVYAVIAFFIFSYLDADRPSYDGDSDYVLSYGGIVACAAFIDGIVGLARRRR
jgi:phosphotransferase system  glucose/maltose/N-acetylglucosamine-specific IIC component